MGKRQYLSGLGNDHSTEALPGTLPVGQNSPQKVARGLYAEQVNIAAFTAPRAENIRSWTYRIQPSVVHEGVFEPVLFSKNISKNFGEAATLPTQYRWDPMKPVAMPTSFLEGLHTIVGNGDPLAQQGGAIHLYSCNKSMEREYFYNADAETVILPWQGSLEVFTELGVLEISPGLIGCVPRGIKFQVKLTTQSSRGYVCENFGRPFRLPELGPVGANGLAARRDFEIPVAHFEEKSGDFELYAKFGGNMFVSRVKQSPFDVVAWHGTLAPYRYDLFKFNVIGSISYDHPDPSIFTVLTSPSELPGTANMDFVVFAPRWLVMENTFRPPYYHRNIMSEFMGLIVGEYDAKIDGGFVPGGSSLHNCMSGHGPDAQAFEKATNATLAPQKADQTMAVMFESRMIWHPTEWALKTHTPQMGYRDCWSALPRNFKR